MQMSKNKMASHYSEGPYRTVDYLKQRRQSGRKLPRKEREQEEGKKKPCKLALKVHPEAMEHDRLLPRRLPKVRQRAV